MAVKVIYFVHGTTTDNKEHKSTGWIPGELTEKGIECDIDVIEKEIIERDYRDMHRDISPLKQADDAVLVDSSDMTIDEVVDKIITLYKG